MTNKAHAVSKKAQSRRRPAPAPAPEVTVNIVRGLIKNHHNGSVIRVFTNLWTEEEGASFGGTRLLYFKEEKAGGTPECPFNGYGFVKDFSPEIWGEVWEGTATLPLVEWEALRQKGRKFKKEGNLRYFVAE